MSKLIPISPLQFDGCQLCKLVIAADPCGGASEGGPDFELGLEFAVDEVERTVFRVLLGILATRPEGSTAQSVNRIEATVEGVFSLPPDAPDEAIHQLVPLNCFAMLYGVVRGIVAQATGLTADGCIWLPSVNFVALLQGAAEKAAMKSKPTSRKKAPARKSAPRKGAKRPAN
jgi:preprotein translocase subunit SecB